MVRPRATCGRWRMVEGRRVVCTFNRGHRGDCKPVRELRAATERAERAEEYQRRKRWLVAHDDSGCAACARYRQAVGVPHDRRVALRCPESRNVVELLRGSEHALDDDQSPADDVLDDE